MLLLALFVVLALVVLVAVVFMVASCRLLAFGFSLLGVGFGLLVVC